MVVTRSKPLIKANTMMKMKRGSLGSLTSLTEKSDSLDADGISKKKTLNASKSLERDLDEISNQGKSVHVHLINLTDIRSLF